MATKNFQDDARDAVQSGDLARLKEVLAAARRHLEEYGDLRIWVSLLEIEIASIEKYRG